MSRRQCSPPPEMLRISQKYYGQGRLNIDGALKQAQIILDGKIDLC